MIVPLTELKNALGIALDDTSQDTALTEQEARVSAWVDNQVKRRFRDPEDRIETRLGSGRRLLYLRGHVADPEAEDAVLITERLLAYGTGEWTDIDGFELRGDSIVRTDGQVWLPNAEYKILYSDGYEEGDAPADIKALVIELVQNERDALTEQAGVTSEKIGDYSYTLDKSAVIGTGVLSDTALGVIQSYKKKFA